MDIKIRMLQLNKKQYELVDALKKRGFSGMCQSTISAIINRRLNTPIAYRAREEIDRILTEWENKEG